MFRVSRFLWEISQILVRCVFDLVFENENATKSESDSCSVTKIIGFEAQLRDLEIPKNMKTADFEVLA